MMFGVWAVMLSRPTSKHQDRQITKKNTLGAKLQSLLPKPNNPPDKQQQVRMLQNHTAAGN